MKSIATRVLTIAMLLCFAFGFAGSQTSQPQIRPWGFDSAGMDLRPAVSCIRFDGADATYWMPERQRNVSTSFLHASGSCSHI